MCMGNPNFLVLDEPTNHLDIETIEALGKGITKYTVSLYKFHISYVSYSKFMDMVHAFVFSITFNTDNVLLA